MRTIAGALACLACAAHENRGQQTNSVSQSSTYKKQRAPHELATLLLSLNPTAGWHLASAVPSYVPLRRNPRRSHAHDISMVKKGQSMEEKKKSKEERNKRRKAEARRFFLETRRSAAAYQEPDEGWIDDDEFEDDLAVPTETVPESTGSTGWVDPNKIMQRLMEEARPAKARPAEATRTGPQVEGTLSFLESHYNTAAKPQATDINMDYGESDDDLAEGQDDDFMEKLMKDYGDISEPREFSEPGDIDEPDILIGEEASGVVEEEFDSETAPMLTSMEDLMKEHGDVSDFDDELLGRQELESETMELPRDTLTTDFEPYDILAGGSIMMDPFPRLNMSLDPDNPPLPGGIGTRTLGIDFGVRRIGIALSSGYVPMPLAVERCKTPDIFSFQRVCKEIQRIARKEWVEQVVVGMPYNSTGQEGKQAAITRVFASILADTVAPCPVFFWDESFSSQEASLTMNEGEGPRRNQEIDAQAAAHILAKFFNSEEEDRNAAPFCAPENKVQIQRPGPVNGTWANQEMLALDVRKQEYYANIDEMREKEREAKEKKRFKRMRKKLQRRKR